MNTTKKKIESIKNKPYDRALNTLDILGNDYSNIENYGEAQEALSLYAQICLVEKADKSAFAATELSKQHQLHAKVSILKGLPALMKSIDKLHVSSDDMQAFKLKLELSGRFKADLTPEGVKASMKAGEITIPEAKELMSMIALQKESPLSDLGELLTSKLAEASKDI